MLTDYETGIISALKTTSPVSIHYGCWFHFTQCIFRKLQELGFSQAYAKDKNFQSLEKNFCSAIFTRTRDGCRLSVLQNNNCGHVSTISSALIFFDYVYDFWLKGNILMEMFCVFDRPPTLQTTNYCEGWNSQWNAEFQHKNPSFWVVLSKLADQECKSRLNLRRLSRGENRWTKDANMKKETRK